MLFLLFRTRLCYYRNYLRHHFDRMVWLEIGLIVVVLFYLAGRSPADIGYDLKFLLAKDFPLQYAQYWGMLLPFFYFIVEALALVTLRPTGEWQMLGALPISKHAITNYHLLRHGAKTGVLLLIGAVPFWIGDIRFIAKFIHFLFASGILLTLQITGFIQAYRLRNTNKKLLQRLLLWLPIETAIILILIVGAPRLHHWLIDSSSNTLMSLPVVWTLALMSLLYIRRTYEPSLIENIAPSEHGTIRPSTINPFRLKGGVNGALIWRDLKFLWMEKRSTFILLASAVAVLLLACLAQSSAEEAYASSIVIEVIFSVMIINVLLILFEHEAKSAGVMRALPINAKTSWKARWLLATGFMAAPIVLVIFIMPFKFAIGAGFALFVGIAFLIPMIFAALFCNAGFGLFPNAKFCSVLLNISLGLMILFWFYMPFGTILLLAISALWIRKSQRHFQFCEIM